MARTSSKERFDTAETQLHSLLLEGLAGDARAYHAFLAALAAHLRRYLRQRLHDADDIEDLVQDCLLAIHDKRHTYEASQPLTAWVHAIARYKLTDHFRRRQSRDFASEVLDDADAIASDRQDATDVRRDLAKLLARLPARQRMPIVQVKIEGLSVAEAASRAGMSIAAVKIGIHRGMKALAAMVRAVE